MGVNEPKTTMLCQDSLGANKRITENKIKKGQ
eukprot:COSAG04_NODE_7252_length_1160_cov_0.799246_2_plen_31_part_01